MAKVPPEINRVEERFALGEKFKGHVHPKTLRGRDLNFLCSRIVVTLDE
jgi:hypothetical protein